MPSGTKQNRIFGGARVNTDSDPILTCSFVEDSRCSIGRLGHWSQSRGQVANVSYIHTPRNGIDPPKETINHAVPVKSQAQVGNTNKLGTRGARVF